MKRHMKLMDRMNPMTPEMKKHDLEELSYYEEMLRHKAPKQVSYLAEALLNHEMENYTIDRTLANKIADMGFMLMEDNVSNHHKLVRRKDPYLI